MKKIIFLIILFSNLSLTNSYSNNELYEKIDLFGEVLEKIKKDYVDDVNESKIKEGNHIFQKIHLILYFLKRIVWLAFIYEL